MEGLAEAGTLAVIEVYPPQDTFFPIGALMNKNLRINAGIGNHPKNIRKLIGFVESGVIDPSLVLTQHEPLTDALAATASSIFEIQVG